MKKLTHALWIALIGVMITFLNVDQVQAQNHNVGFNWGGGARFTSGSTFLTTATLQYKYQLSPKIGLGGNLGIYHAGGTGFLLAGSFDYYFMSEKIRPYASVDLGGVLGNYNALYVSPGGGVKVNFDFAPMLDFEAGLRLPITTAFNSVGVGLTFNIGVHYRF